MDSAATDMLRAEVAEAPLSEDQQVAWDCARRMIAAAGITLEGEPSDKLSGSDADTGEAFAILGKAGSGKTQLLARLGAALKTAGSLQITSDYEPKRGGKRTFAIVAPTNKAASVLRTRGVEATTIHRVIYSPVYDPEYERIADWLRGDGSGKPPAHDLLGAGALERALAFFRDTGSVPGALATAGVRGAEFITGWARREDNIDIGLVDEASMLDRKALDDLRQVFKTLILFGDPAQLAPVGAGDGMAFDHLPAPQKVHLSRVHRQSGDNPIIDLAYALEDPQVDFREFERRVEEAARRDERVVVAPRANPDLMARSPMLVWRNATRLRLIWAFRKAFEVPDTVLLPGEPLICDGAEIPMKQRKKRIALEQVGLVKGAQVFFLGPGKKPGFARLRVAGAQEPQIAAASIIQIERGDDAEPLIPFAARMGAVFVHGAACTIHKAQGSQWPDVQVFAPDLYAAAQSGRIEDGIPLWKRLAYVAITRAEERMHWVTRYAMARPKEELAPPPA